MKKGEKKYKVGKTYPVLATNGIEIGLYCKRSEDREDGWRIFIDQKWNNATYFLRKNVFYFDTLPENVKYKNAELVSYVYDYKLEAEDFMNRKNWYK